MGLRIRLICSLGIILLGWAAALPFYHPVPPELPAGGPGVTGSTSSGSEPEVLSHPMALQIVSDEPSLPVAEAKLTPGTRAENSIPGSGAPPRWSRTEEPPGIAAEFPAAGDSVPPAAPLTPLVQASPAAPGPGAGHSVRPDEEDLDREPAGPRMHRIRDGDTLPRLARRYLGTEQRWPEILALNQDVIPNPELLPIGKWVRLPGRDLPSLPADPPAARPLDPPLTTLAPVP
ncbi:MAG: LysM peptidoglycan-binding domain-containing protein [Pirellulaceae bacterium]